MAEATVPQTAPDEITRIHRRLGRMKGLLDEALSRKQSVDKGTQILLAMKYRELAAAGTVLPFHDVGFRNYSQDEEDGILHYIFSLIGTTDRRAVEICAGNGQECNTANLIINQQWHALLVDGNKDHVHNGRAFFSSHPDTRIMCPQYSRHWISRETVNDMLRQEGFSGEIDLLSLDLDGVDYWVWEALEQISPRVVVAEVMPTLGMRSLTVPYSADFEAQWVFLGDEKARPEALHETASGGFWNNWAMYAGASLPAFNALAKRKGYRLIGSNSAGHNAFFLRADVAQDVFPEASVESCLNPSYRELFERSWDKLKDFEWQQV